MLIIYCIINKIIYGLEEEFSGLNHHINILEETMKNKELFNIIKSYSDDLKEIFNPIHESTIISSFYIDFLEDVLYRNILDNFFNNLTEDNIKDAKLLTSDLEKIKKDYESIQKDIIISLEDVDELIFDKSYYYSSKKEILTKYPTLENLFNEIETLIDLSSIEGFINNQKLEYVTEIKEYRIIIKTLIFEKLIKDKHFKEVFRLDQIDLAEYVDINELSKGLVEKSMKIRKWEIWKTYSTYTNRTFNRKEFKELSEILVKNNIVTSIFDSDCSVIWNDEEKIKKDKLFDLKSSTGNSELLNKLPDYAAEGTYQFYLMWISEEKILKSIHYDYSYIKGFLSPIIVTFKSGQQKTLYPQLTIYNTGILNLTFRTISPEPIFDYEVNSFIYNEVNSNNLQIKYVELSYELLKNVETFKIDFLEKNKKIIKLGSFKHIFVKINGFENLLNLTQELVSIIFGFISKKFKNVDYSYNYWVYSQSIYLLDYNNQPYYKEDIIENFKEYLIQILYRLPFLFNINSSMKLPEDLRKLDNYCLFIIQGMSLWISSKDESDIFKEDINNENAVYEKQVLVEAINHFNLLVNKLYGVSKDNNNYNEIIKLQKDLINFERLFKTSYVSNFGEINHIFDYCYQELEWDDLIGLSNKLLDINKNHQLKRRDENLQYLVILIAVLSLCSQLMVIDINLKIFFILIDFITFILVFYLIFLK